MLNEKFQKHLESLKSIDGDVVKEYVKLYSQCTQSKEELEAFKDKIKEIALKKGQLIMAPADSPFMLEVQLANSTSRSWQSIAETFAKKLYGKDFAKRADYKKVVRANTEFGTQEKLLEPSPNPNYEK